MQRAAIVGAGVMGSALAVPLADNGCAVALCGTPFDRAAIASIRETGRHPGLGVQLPEAVLAFDFTALGEALAGATVVVLGVVSDALAEIARAVGPHLAPGACIVNVAKGIEALPHGGLRTLPEVIRGALPAAAAAGAALVAVAGPCKALELAVRKPTEVVFASEDPAALARCRALFATAYYRVSATDDLKGVEVCAPAKNGYAIGLGIIDGLEQAAGGTLDNLRAALFHRATLEMAALAAHAGGRRETAFGLAGMGDLFVTYRQGRNQTLGRLLGEGLPAAEACARMAGATVEGVAAVREIHRALEGAFGAKEAADRFPLLAAIHAVLFRGAGAARLAERMGA
jgi:glycerol-3-phosphate dehydrogenase (NAD(P)+)